jgi:hypothetical protein
MIYGRGKCLHKVLGLAAYKAARRFAARRLAVPGRRDAWRPMVLRWRLRRRPMRNVIVGRGAPHSQVSWFPQFHFHFASHPSERTRPNPGHGRSPAANSQPQRVVIDHRWTNVPTTTSLLQLDHASQPAREIYERHGSRAREHAPVILAPQVSWPLNNAQSQEHFPVAPRIWWLSSTVRSQEHAPVTAKRRVAWPSLAKQLCSWPTQRRHQRPFERTPGVRERMRGEGQTQFLQTRSQILQHWNQVFSLQRPKLFDPVPELVAESKTSQFQYDRPEELRWRRGLRKPVSSDHDKRTEVSLPDSRTPTRSQPGHEFAAGVAPLLERAAATQVTNLDPGVLDRLTDDVIRRVEQRLRIERQRRGL